MNIIKDYAQRAYDNALKNNATEDFDDRDFTALDITTEPGMWTAIDNEVDALGLESHDDTEARKVVASAIALGRYQWLTMKNYPSFGKLAVRIVKLQAYEYADIYGGEL